MLHQAPTMATSLVNRRHVRKTQRHAKNVRVIAMAVIVVPVVTAQNQVIDRNGLCVTDRS